jgi:predicted ATPase
MPNLQLALLGPWQMHVAGQPVTHFPTTKVQALLAYLSVEAQSAHTRDALLGLFWAEYRADSARQNLRKTLQRLRQILPASYLQATSQTIQFDPASDYHLDVTAFIRLVAACRHQPLAVPLACSACIDQLHQAVDLYRGDFLAHFFVEGSPAFEEWLLLKREWLRREALGALQQLTAHHQRQGAYDRAYTYAWRQLELDPLREEAHQQLMSILALRGQRSEALAQYETCRRILADELAVEPSHVAPCAQFVRQWLHNSPDLHILATSREPLHLRGEQRYPVAPLSADAACQLFVQCARQVEPAFALTPASAAIGELCRRLDYLPLAIELLAARIDLFSPEAMLVRLEASRLDLLSGDARDLPPRQQTVRNAIQHSYELLTGGERALFCTLGVFTGGFDLPAVAHFGFGDELLQSLLQKSLVRPDPSNSHARRFFMLETLREYAREQLSRNGELLEKQQQHAAYYLALAQTAEPALMGAEQYQWAQQLEGEMGNLRTALGWLQAADVEKGLQLANALWFFWLMHNHLREGRQWLESLLTHPGGTLASRAKAAVSTACYARFQGDYTAVAAFAPLAADLARAAGDKRTLGHAFIYFGRAAIHQE